MQTKQSWLSRHITLHNQATRQDEWENFITHFIGFIAATVFLFIVLIQRNRYDGESTWIGMIIYWLSLVLLYLSSSIYHIAPKGDLKRLMRICDHANIYLLIAGTYTPILLYIGTSITVRIVIFMWLVALFGILFSILFWGRLPVVHVALYLIMGWMIIFFWQHIVPFIPRGLLVWVIAAGVTYTSGVVFYANKRLPHNHMIWHLFCIGASALFCIGFFLHLTI